MRLRVLSENAIRVVAWPAGSPEPSRASLAVIAAAATSGFETREEAGAAVLRTPRLTARVSLGTGEVAFEDEAGRPLLREKAGGGKTFTPVKIFGEATLMVRQELEGAEGESLYGLGQHQDRLLDLAGRDLDLWQHNREVVVPFLVSTRRWGLLWDNPAHMRFGRPEDVTPLPSSAAVDESGQPGRFTAAFFADRDLREALTVPPPSGIGVPPASGPETVAYGGPPTSFAPVSLPPEIVAKCLSARWTGFSPSPAPASTPCSWPTRSGRRSCGSTIGSSSTPGAPRCRRPTSPGCASSPAAATPSASSGSAPTREHARARVAAPRAGLPRSRSGRLPPRASTTSSCAGTTLDEVIAGYRELTGRAALLARWALGYWQSRERYKTAEELVGTVEGVPRAAASPSTSSSRTGSTGGRGRGARTTSTPPASPTPRP